MLPGNEVNFIGYLIEGNVVYLHKTKRLICLNGHGEDIILRKTMSHVLEYLFENATTDVVTDSELMENVWDKHGLSSSTQRVWQVMSNLKSKLFFLGLSDDVILRVSKKGYLLKNDSVERLFSSRVTSGIH
ncbi:winged helix-turn-helix domain-containing protein [Pantoea agglomerans]|uniref:winged helix-turn-helix domain-containing protein n=1 Tax=Enterobacter agglomerans TaxID=549 RepID=UPI002017E9C2|nr:helix-turn-helix domain-containing protein [Pantoea agglomerans]